eukprot:8304347-Pyramimonas_sp.AAC.1
MRLTTLLRPVLLLIRMPPLLILALSGVDRTPAVTRRLVNCPYSVLERAPWPLFSGLAPDRLGPQ